MFSKRWIIFLTTVLSIFCFSLVFQGAPLVLVTLVHQDNITADSPFYKVRIHIFICVLCMH